MALPDALEVLRSISVPEAPDATRARSPIFLSIPMLSIVPNAKGSLGYGTTGEVTPPEFDGLYINEKPRIP